MDVSKESKTTKRPWIVAAVVVAILVAMFFSTTIESETEAKRAAASESSGPAKPAPYAKKHYSKDIVPTIKKKADKVTKLSKAIDDDPDAAAEKYAHVEGDSDPVYSVTVKGRVASTDDSGRMRVKVPGIADGIKVYVQTGPSISGTAIRDASGTVHFKDFKNQIEYQDVGTELNKRVKKKVLKDVDPEALKGESVTITGAFQFVNPKTFMIVPVEIED